MILRCSKDMTETSSTHCFLRCLGRCFGIDRNRETIKTTLEPTENGFLHMENGEKPNGSTTVVKLCEPNGNSFNKQLQSMSEKTCCILTGDSSDELQYSYEPVPSSPSKNLVNGAAITADSSQNDKLGSIDANSEDLLITSDQAAISNPKYSIKDTLKTCNEDQYVSDSVKVESIEKKVSEVQERSRQEDMLSKEPPSVLDNNKDLSDIACIEVKFIENNDPSNKGSEAVNYAGITCACDSKTAEEDFITCNGDVTHLKQNEKSQGDLVKNVSTLVNGARNNSEEHNIQYFKNLIESETIRLCEQTQKWEKVLSDEPDIHEEVRDEIRSVNGQTHLVISERFSQFKSLVERSEKQANGELKEEKIITLTDLQGFWDMIYFQVQDVLVKFQRLDKVQNANWNHELLHENGVKPQPVKKTKRIPNGRPKRAPKTATSQASSTSQEEKARRLAARKRLAEARKKMAAQERPRSISDENFIVQ